MTHSFRMAVVVIGVMLATSGVAMAAPPRITIEDPVVAVVQPNDNTKMAVTATGYFEFNGAGNGTFGSVTIKIRYDNGDGTFTEFPTSGPATIRDVSGSRAKGYTVTQTVTYVAGKTYQVKAYINDSAGTAVGQSTWVSFTPAP